MRFIQSGAFRLPGLISALGLSFYFLQGCTLESRPESRSPNTHIKDVMTFSILSALNREAVLHLFLNKCVLQYTLYMNVFTCLFMQAFPSTLCNLKWSQFHKKDSITGHVAFKHQSWPCHDHGLLCSPETKTYYCLQRNCALFVTLQETTLQWEDFLCQPELSSAEAWHGTMHCIQIYTHRGSPQVFCKTPKTILHPE